MRVVDQITGEDLEAKAKDKSKAETAEEQA